VQAAAENRGGQKMRRYQCTGVAAFFNEAGKEYRAFPDDRDLQCHLSLDYAEWFKPRHKS